MREPDVVRHNLDTDRVVTACECGRTVSLPGSGLSEHLCVCGRGWKCDGSYIAMYVPKEWMGGEKGLADTPWRRFNADYTETSGHICPTCGEVPNGCVHQREEGPADG